MCSGKDIRFKLVLNGDDDEVAHYLSQFDISANLVVFLRTDTPETFYSSAVLLLNLSRYVQWVETFGLTLIEGMSFGLPVIAPPVGGPTKIITNGESGYLINSRERERLRTAVLGLADASEEAMAMSHAGRRRASDFTIGQFVENLAAQIKHLSASKDTEESQS